MTSGGDLWDQPSAAHVRPQPATGMLLGVRYKLEENLHGPVWTASDTTLTRPVYIQVLDPTHDNTQRVLTAARRAASSNDPRIARVMDAYSAAGQEQFSFVVCEQTPGMRLDKVVGNQPLSNSESAYVIREIAEALTAPHAAGEFDQHLHPDRIVLTDIGGVKILGFLLDAAFDGTDQLDTWHEREDRDLKSLGALLYACLTGLWPHLEQVDSHESTLPLAPLQDLAKADSWVSPKAIRPSVHTGLDQLAMILLRHGANHPKYGSAANIASVLTHILGKTEPREELEARMRRQLGPSEPSWTTSATAVIQQPDQGPPTAQMPAVENQAKSAAAFSDAPTQAFTAANQPGDYATQPMQAVPPTPVSQTPYTKEQPAVPAPIAKQQPPTVKGEPRQAKGPKRAISQPAPSGVRAGLDVRSNKFRLVALLVVIILVVLFVAGIRSCGGSAEPAPTAETTQQAAQPVEVVNVTDFDPPADGGEGNENADRLPLMSDGDPETAWRTWNYYGNPHFGNLKPGAGVVLDLGQVSQVNEVSLLLEDAPVDVQLMIPAEDPASQTPPTDTVGQWTAIATLTDAQRETTLAPESPTDTRWLLIYFTKLPQVDENSYRTGICEYEVR